jgi:tetratricopeptide (TPR) repeat protein
MRFSKQVLSLLVICSALIAVQSPVTAQVTRDPTVLEAYDAGLQLLEEEKYEEAIAEFGKAAADDTFAEAFLGEGDALRMLEDYQAAIQSYTKARDRDPRLARAHFGLGICHKEQGDINLAMNDFMNAIDLDRRDPEIVAHLGKLYLDVGDPTNALRTLQTAVELNPDDADVYSDRGWAYTQLRQTDEGIADLNKSIELDPEVYETYFRLANIYLFLEDYKPAIEALTNTIKYYKPEESTDPKIYVNGYLYRADAEMRLAGQEDTPSEERDELYKQVIAGAETVLEEYPDKFPESGSALFAKGRALRMLLRYGEAIKALTDAIQAASGVSDASYLPEAYLKRGICWLNQGEPNLARRDFEQAASLNYEDPLPYLWIGFTYSQQKDYRKAIESFGESIAKNPAQAAAYVNRGLAYMQEEDYKKAVDNFNEAIRSEPTESEHFYKRGIAYMWLEDYDKAFTSFELATLFNDKHVKAFRAGALAARKLDRTSDAEQYESRAQELEAAQAN